MSHLESGEESHDVSYADISRNTGVDDFDNQIKKMSSTISESESESDGSDVGDISDCKEVDGNKTEMCNDKENNLGWRFESTDDSFISFYDEKKSAINGWLLPFGEIDFKDVMSELSDARVDLSSLHYGDLNKVFSLMKDIQQWRDRVAQIAIRINAQYYSWKRAIDLFTGLLAQYKYEKPAIKQEGVVYEHMGDMVRYYSQLESSHKSVEMILKNLDNAFECLSRQVTISMPGKDHEDLEKKASNMIAGENVNKEKYTSSTDLSDSDKSILSDLDTVSSSKPGRNKLGIKTGKVSWNDNF
jgi:hypothetical protein